MNKTRRVLIWILAILMTVTVTVGSAEDGETEKVWILCSPTDYVNLRMQPSKRSAKTGFVECGDAFTTSGKKRNGFLQVLDVGECACWVHAGYVVTEEPVVVNEYYCVVAKTRVACRRWVNGPRIAGRRGWLNNGSRVKVYSIGGGWAVTSRGFIQSEWLEVDPS